MLSGNEILKQIELGNIVIEPFNRDQLNPNSYNLTLGDEIQVYISSVLDSAKKNPTKKIKIGTEGYVLSPNNVYLVNTSEYTETKNFVPQLSGRSSVGRIGLSVHLNSGLGQVGYKGKWLLGLTCIIPVRVFPNMKIAQIYYFPVDGQE
jgi:dCTP deaminase